MLSNKKASQYGVLITIIIVLLSAGALFSMVNKSTKVADDVSEGLACYTFLGMKKATQDLSGGALNLAKNCQTIETSIPGKHNPTNKYQLENLFAKKIAKAWHIVHEGKIENLWGTDKLGNIIGDEEKCIILYSITYEDSRQSLGLTANLTEFKQFLMTSPAFTEDGREWSYLEYIEKYGAPSHLVLVPRFDETNFYTDSVKYFLKPGETYGIAIAAIDRASLVSDPGSIVVGTVVGIAVLAAVIITLPVSASVAAVAGAVAASGSTYGVDNLLKSISKKDLNEVQDDENAFVMFGDLTTLQNSGCVIITPSD